MTATTPDPQELSPAASSTAATTKPAATAAAPAAAPASTPAKAVPPPRPPATPRSKSNGSGVAGGAFVTAVCALLVAIGAVAVAVYSLKVARDALSRNAEQAPAVSASATSTTEVPATAAAPAPTASVPRVSYFAELVRVELRITAPTSCNSAYVDVDTMATGVQAGHEFYLSTCKDPLTPEFRVDRTSGASPSSPNPNPEVCAALIAGTQTTPELVLTARNGLTFCLLTNKADATSQNLPQRLAIVEVRDVTVDRTVTIAVSTYRIG